MRNLVLPLVLGTLVAACAHAPGDDADTDVAVDSEPADTEVAPGPVTLRGADGLGDLLEVTVDGDRLSLRALASTTGHLGPVEATLQAQDDGLVATDSPHLGPLVVRDDLVAGFVLVDEAWVLFVATAEAGSAAPLHGDWEYVDRWCSYPLPCDTGFDVTIGSFRLADDGRWGDCKEGFAGTAVDDCPTGIGTSGTWRWDDDGRLELTVQDAVVGRGHVSPGGLIVGGIPEQPDQGPGLFVGVPSLAVADLDGAWVTVRSDGTHGRITFGPHGWAEGAETGALWGGVPHSGWSSQGVDGSGPLLAAAGDVFVRTDSPSGTWMEVGVRVVSPR